MHSFQSDTITQASHGEFGPPHRRTQPLFRVFGPVVMGFGVVLALIGLGSFVASLRTLEPPTYLWAVMVGLPLLGVGAGLARFGRDGSILRDLAQEVAVLEKEPFRTQGVASGQGAKPPARSAGSGPATTAGGDGSFDSATAPCRRCHAANPPDARFCNQCGTSLLESTCPGCGAMITSSARFCTQCGKLVG